MRGERDENLLDLKQEKLKGFENDKNKKSISKIIFINGLEKNARALITNH